MCATIIIKSILWHLPSVEADILLENTSPLILKSCMSQIQRERGKYKKN